MANEQGSPEKAAKAERSAGEQALRFLRNAKRAANDDGSPTAQAEFLLSQANVLALLELADAVRGSRE